jgi:hypothetical protein
MIVPALHLTAAARGIDVSTSEKMRLFAECEIIKLTQRVISAESKQARECNELRKRTELVEAATLRYKNTIIELLERARKAEGHAFRAEQIIIKLKSQLT